MSVFDITTSAAGEVVRNPLSTTIGEAYIPDTDHATYRFISGSTGIEFTLNGETLLSFAQPVPNPNEVHPLPTLQAYTADTYFDCLNVTLGKCYDSKISAEKAAVPFGRQLFCVIIR